MKAKDLREKISKMYSRLNYDKFCEYMGFNPKYDERYWEEFAQLAHVIQSFDDTRLQKILDFGQSSDVEKGATE